MNWIFLRYFIITNITYKWSISYICTMPDLPQKLLEKLALREKEGALRTLPKKNNLIDFSSNDYLGFAKNEVIYSNTFQRILKQGDFQNGASGSRLLSGNHPLYGDLETFLAQTHQTESALVFNSGYDANIGFFSSVPQRGDAVFYDEFIHVSIRDGVAMGHAKGYKFAHNNLGELQLLIQRVRANLQDGDIYVVTESVFSMDGDTPDLIALVDFCNKNRCHLIVDEAHAVGVFGPEGVGMVQELKLQHSVFARIVTFGKAMGCHGAAILGSNPLKRYLINFARSFIYTTGLTPHTIATILSAYEYVAQQGEKDQSQLKKNIVIFKEKMVGLQLQPHFIPSESAIQSCVVSGNIKVKTISKKLTEKGFDVRAILSPTVPEGQERLRFCIHSYNSKEEMELVLELLQSLI